MEIPKRFTVKALTELGNAEEILSGEYRDSPVFTPPRGFQAGDPIIMFEGRYLTSFDVSPDRTKFILVKDEYGKLPSILNVILNWNKELPEKTKSSE